MMRGGGIDSSSSSIISVVRVGDRGETTVRGCAPPPRYREANRAERRKPLLRAECEIERRDMDRGDAGQICAE